MKDDFAEGTAEFATVLGLLILTPFLSILGLIVFPIYTYIVVSEWLRNR